MGKWRVYAQPAQNKWIEPDLVNTRVHLLRWEKNKRKKEGLHSSNLIML